MVHSTITAGELDIYPEYTGNGAFFFLTTKRMRRRKTRSRATNKKVKQLDAEKNQLVWLMPAPANNTWSIAVRQDMAQQNKLSSLEDLSRYLKQGGTFKLAASAEFIKRGDALPAFESL
nr:ABC transporter substrate-binding protein [Candidatus Pantoea persica]